MRERELLLDLLIELKLVALSEVNVHVVWSEFSLFKAVWNEKTQSRKKIQICVCSQDRASGGDTGAEAAPHCGQAWGLQSCLQVTALLLTLPKGGSFSHHLRWAQGLNTQMQGEPAGPRKGKKLVSRFSVEPPFFAFKVFLQKLC